MSDLREKIADICDAEIQSDHPSCYTLADAIMQALGIAQEGECPERRYAMTKAPERIWAVEGLGGSVLSFNDYPQGGTEYTRTDTIPALLAAEREKALREAADFIRRYMLDAGIGSKPFIELNNEMAKAILAPMDKKTKPIPPS